MERKLQVVDLFVGCGGLTEGFEQTGQYETIACVEWETEPCRTLRNRLREKWGYLDADARVLQCDIQQVDELLFGKSTNDLFAMHRGLDEMVREAGGVDLIVGGPPCQAYSVAGRVRDENGMHDDYRNFLFESYVKIVDYFQPKAFVFENVPGMLSAMPNGISIVNRITEAFRAIGYEIIQDLRKFALIDSTQYGVPQNRRRVIILGVDRSRLKKYSQNPQLALHEFYRHILPAYRSDSLRTVRDAIADLPPLMPLRDFTANGRGSHSHAVRDIPNHMPRTHNQRDMKIFEELASDIESGEMRYGSIEAIKKLYTERTGRQSNIHKYYVLRWDQPSNTIPAHLYKDGLRHIHPDPAQKRSITVREAARLQTFDDDFVFTGSLTEQFKMVGNAVPPRLARAIGFALETFLKEYVV